jgi:hypothetical protein
MSKRSSSLDKVQKLVDDIYSESDNNIAFFAVELDEKGFPLGRMQKVKATPGVALGALSMLEEAIEDAKKDAFRTINLAGELSDKIGDLFKKLGIEDPDQVQEKLDSISDPEIKRQLKEAIKRLKDQF